MSDVFHTLCLICLMIVPWRFWQCWEFLLENEKIWELRVEEKAIALLNHGFSIFDRLYYEVFHPLFNNVSKDKKIIAKIQSNYTNYYYWQNQRQRHWFYNHNYWGHRNDISDKVISELKNDWNNQRFTVTANKQYTQLGLHLQFNAYNHMCHTVNVK